MIPGGVLDTVAMSNGQFRFRYITPAGAEYHGARLYKKKTDAMNAGKKWLANETRGKT